MFLRSRRTDSVRRAVLLLLLATVFASPALAVDYFAETGGGAWEVNTTWRIGSTTGPNPPAGVYPGSAPGDTANLTLNGTVTLSIVLPNPVALQQSCSCTLSVNSGGVLSIGSASSVGGLGILAVNGGTIANASTIDFAPNTNFDWMGGELTGSGTTNLNSGFTTGSRMDVVSGANVVSGAQTINATGSSFTVIDHAGGSLAINDSVQINVSGGAEFQVGTTAPITTNAPSTADINVGAGGTFRKYAGAGGTNIDVPVNNSGTVIVSAGGLVLGGSPVHNGGTFDLAAGTSLEPNGTFTGACSVIGSGSLTIAGVPVVANGATLGIAASSELTMNGGWLQGPVAGVGTVNVSGTVTFTGGEWRRNLVVNMLTGASLDFPGTAACVIDDADVTVASGAFLSVDPGPGSLAVNNGGTITNGGTFSLRGDATLNSNLAAAPRITNNSLLQKTAGAGSAVVNVPFNNNGDVQVQSGDLQFRAGGTHTGTWTLAPILVAARVGGPPLAPAVGETLTFGGGTHQITAGSFIGTGTVALTGGTLDADTAVTLPSSIAFQQSGGVLTGSGAFTVDGAFAWSGGTMDGSSGSGVTNLNGTTNQFVPATSITLSGRTINHAGLGTYNPGTGALAISSGANFSNTGTFDVVGDAVINSNLLLAPRFTNDANGAINKSTGTGTFRINSQFFGAGTINVSSGTVTIAGGGQDLGTVNFGSAANKVIIDNCSFVLATAPAINGAGVIVVQGASAAVALGTPVTIPSLEFLGGTISGSVLNVSSSLLWRSGTMSGGTTQINATATATATSLTGTIALSAHTLQNLATFTWDGSQPFQLSGGSSFINSGTFDATGAGTIGGTPPSDVVTNNGTLRKTGGSAGTRIDAMLVNNSLLSSQVNGQALILAGGGSQSGGGTLSTAAGAAIDFSGGTFTVAAGTSPFLGSGAYRVNGGILQITASMSVPAPAVVAVNSGSLSVATGSTFAIQGGLQWNGGTLTGDGTTRTFGGSIASTAPKTLNGDHTLSIGPGTVSYTGVSPNILTIGGTANLNVESGATLAMASGTTIAGTSPDGLTISGGILDATAGTATLNSGGSMSAGSINGGTLMFGAGTFAINGGAVTGTLGVSGGTLNVDSTLTVPALLLSAGTLGGTGALTVNGGTWTGGSMSGSGSTTVAASATFSVNAGTSPTLARNLTNLGTLNINSALSFTSGTLTNSSQLNLNNAGIIGSGGVVQNAAAGSLTLVSGTATLPVPLNNAGSVTSNGSLSLTGGGTHSGDFTSAVSIGFGGTHMFATTSDLSGAGAYLFGPGTSTLGGTYTAGATSVLPGTTTTFNTTSTASLGSATILGNVAGTAPLSISGSGSSWQSGTISGSGNVTVSAGGVLSISGAGLQTLEGRTLINNGSLTISTSIAAGSGGSSISNQNTLQFNPAGSITIGVPVANQATATFLSGTTAFTGGYSQSAGTTQLTGGTFTSPLTVNISGGQVIGNGTIGANVINAGIFAPGLSAGTITVAGNYTQTSTGGINAEIGGPAPGTGYDQLVVTGTATLDGALNAVLINGFMPADGNVFDLVTWSARAGTFATVNLPAYPIGVLTPTYEPNAFRVTAVGIADLAVTKTGPTTGSIGQNVTFTIQVANNGPSAATSVMVSDPTPANLSFVSNSGDCTTPFPCALGTMNTTETRTISATYTVTGGAGTTITNTASVSSTTTDSASANNTSSAALLVQLADVAIVKTGPARARPGQDIDFTISVVNGGVTAAQNVVVNDPAPAGLTFVSNSGDCTTAFPCNLGTLPGGATRTIVARFSIGGQLAGSSVTNTATVTTTTADDPANNSSSATFTVDCVNQAPDQLAPSGTAAGTGTLSWRGRGQSYNVYLGPAGSGCSTLYKTTTSSSVPYTDLAPGAYEWRVESVRNDCPPRFSSCTRFTVVRDCVVPGAPLPRVVGQATSARTYSVEWDPVPDATRYEIDEAGNPDFIGSSTLAVTGVSREFSHDVAATAAFYYRVRAFTDCATSPGPHSVTVRVVIVPPPAPDALIKSVSIPVGSQDPVLQQVFIPGQPGQNLTFTATTDRPWLSVRPTSGVITPAGIILDVIADPRNLTNGTFTASVIVTITTPGAGVSVQGTTTTAVPVSVNLVTPVTPVATKPPASQYALIIPSTGHLAGIGSQWQSDVRVTNAGFRSARYRLTFTPSGGTAQGVKQTDITVDAGATTALDDVISNWFGLGILGDGVNGMLEIVPLDDPATTSLSTVASSRTYNISGNGTLGQFIPAVPFPSFIGRALPGALPAILSLQQIAQNQTYRTNVGLAEASGLPVQAVVSVFNTTGTKLTDIPLQLAGGEQTQMNQLLAQQGLTLDDGRIEVKVTGGDGKVTAYASVVDGRSQDPLLVSGQRLTQTGSAKYVLPGVANLQNPAANWQTDMRVFNYGTTSQPATLTFYPMNNGPAKTANVLLAAGQVMTLNDLLRSQFAAENTGGVVHVTTPQPSSLVVTGRTYNQTSNGTFGQFVPAVTEQQAAGANGRTLHILQVEDSSRYRTNVGIAEVTGRPVTVEMQIVLPDSKITPTVQFNLAANEFQQFNPIRALDVGNVYNARISVRVVGGQGQVTAYGSVIDELTQDPTYVPAQ